MTTEPAPEHPTQAGEVVRDKAGNLGIVTEPARKAGPYKGQVSVTWAFGRYTVAEWPEELTVIAPATVRNFTETLATRTES